MSSVITETREKVEHRYVIPTSWPAGGAYGDLVDAINFAARDAKRYGIDTTTDDWLRIIPEDDQIVLQFVTTGPPKSDDEDQTGKATP